MEINYCKNPKIELGKGVEEKIKDYVLELFFDSDKDYMEAFEGRGYKILFSLESRVGKESEMKYLPVLEIVKEPKLKGAARSVARKSYMYNCLTTEEECGVVKIEMKRPELSLEK